jgi:diacylglycerol kinase
MVKKCTQYNIGFIRIATDDGSVLLQFLLAVAVVSAGIFLQLNVLQWIFVSIITSVFLFTGIYRSAVHLLTNYDDDISLYQAVRIKAMSNIIVIITAGFTLFSYLLIFMPKINVLL